MTGLLVGLISNVYLGANALEAKVVAWEAAGLVLTPRAWEKHDQQVVAVSHLRSDFIKQSPDLVRITSVSLRARTLPMRNPLSCTCAERS